MSEHPHGVRTLPEDWKTRPRHEQIRLHRDAYGVCERTAVEMICLALYGSVDRFPNPPPEP